MHVQLAKYKLVCTYSFLKGLSTLTSMLFAIFLKSLVQKMKNKNDFIARIPLIWHIENELWGKHKKLRTISVEFAVTIR